MGTTIGRAGEEPPSGGEVRLGKYVLDAPLGVGGMAEVFKGRTVGAEGFQRPVAIKRVLPDASKNPAFSEMFIAEATLSARLQHPNIVSVLDFNRDEEGRLYLVMELVEGRDLDDIIESGRLPFSVVIYTIVEVLRGLGYAHDLPLGTDGVRGLVHRDVSPHNVVCSWSGAVKVSDFGIAKARAATAASASMVIKGKPAYMSPEQINGAPLDGRSDLFAVGVMLWQMLAGQHLFAAGSVTETFARVLLGTIPSPRSVVADVPPDLEAVTMRLLEREPERRYQTAEDAIDDLLRCQHAPRDGRRELEQLLVVRYPQKAPQRTGQRSRAAHALAAGTPADPPPRAAASGLTGTGGPPQPATVPGYRGAIEPPPPAPPPGTTGAPTAGRKTALLVGGLVAVVAAVVVVVVVASGGGDPTPSTGSTPAAAIDAGQAVMDAAEPADAATTPTADAAPAVVAPAPADAAPADAAPPIDARPRGARPGRDAGGTGIHDITGGTQ